MRRSRTVDSLVAFSQIFSTACTVDDEDDEELLWLFESKMHWVAPTLITRPKLCPDARWASRVPPHAMVPVVVRMVMRDAQGVVCETTAPTGTIA